MSTAAAKRHMGRIAEMPCIVCSMLGLGDSSSHVHHIREGRIARNDFLTLPVCPSHHVGSYMSVHHDKPRLLRALNVHSEFDLLAAVLEHLE